MAHPIIASVGKMTELTQPTKLFQPAEVTQELVQKITHNGQLLAIIIYSNFSETGVHFFTPNALSQQLAYMKHPAGKVLQPHVHNPVARKVYHTQEVLLIKKGKLRVDFYSEQQQYLESRILADGDVILLVAGGHGFEVIEELEMIEVKQGPYVGEQDKTRFPGITANQVNVVEQEHPTFADRPTQYRIKKVSPAQSSVHDPGRS